MKDKRTRWLILILGLCLVLVVVKLRPRREYMDWNHPYNVAVITTQEIADGKKPILLVTHDEGYGGWQFMPGGDISGKKPLAIPREDILKIDPTLQEVTDLPIGWRAVRATAKSEWIKEPNPDKD